MKLIVTGATGFVGEEVIRLALRNKSVTSVVALARKEIPVPNHVGPETDTSKLKSVPLEDWETPYPNSVLEQLKGADACIWTLAITPTKSKNASFDEVTKVCLEYTVNGLKSIAPVANKTFRFIYTSGVTVERDQTKTLPFLQEYRLMRVSCTLVIFSFLINAEARGRVENAVLDFAKQNAPAVEVAITKPGGIEGPDHPKNEALTSVWAQFNPTPWVHVSEVAAAMIEQALNGIDKDTLWGNDLQIIGSKALKSDNYTFGN